jgi:diguanylate cyclase (GGDEF)-like protein
LIDFSTLFVSAAISAFVLSGMIFTACFVLRQAGYLLTMGCGVLCVGIACAVLAYYRMGGDSIYGMATIVSLMASFLLVHWAMSQYMGRSELGLFELATIPAMSLCCVIFGLGYDGAAFMLCYLVTAILIFDTSLLYWSHRHEVPYLMHGLTALGVTTGLLFVLRAYALASADQWVIGSAPNNWAESLTAVAAVSFVTAFGPMVVALYHVRDRVALISEAATDPLTGLSNRRALYEAFEEAHFSSAMGVIMFDLDHFKKTNDVFGHQIGDDVLKRFAYVVGRHAGSDATAYRLGGEEFAVVSTRGGESRAHELANRINISFGAEVVRTQLGPLRSTVSCGVAGGSAAANRLSELLALADAALYEAKRSGRNRVVSHSHMALGDTPQDRRVA